MGFLDELKKLTRPYDEDEEDFLDEAEVVSAPERPKANPFAGFGCRTAEPAEPAPAAAPVRQSVKREGKVVNIGSAASGQMQVVLVKPERFETAAEIADHLAEKRAVLVNLETTPKDVTRRLVDFLSGVAYASEGRIKKVGANTYIITAYPVEMVGDLLDELESSGAFLQ